MTAQTLDDPALTTSRLIVLIHAIRAEGIKACTSSFTWSAIAVTAIVTLAAAIGMGAIGRNAAATWGTGDTVALPHFAIIGFLTVGVLGLLANAAWLVVGEGVTHTAGVTALAVPSRSTVILAKAVVAAITTWVTTIVLTPTALFTTQLVYSPSDGEAGFLAEGALRIVLVLPLTFACLSIATVGVAAAVRNVAASFGVVVAWYALAEDWIRRIPGVGEVIAPYLPVSAALSLAGVETQQGGSLAAVGQFVALVFWTAALLTIGISIHARRDVST